MKTALMVLAMLTATQDAKDPEKVRVTAEFKNTTFAAALEALRKQSGVPIEVDEAAKKVVDFEKDLLTLKLNDIVLTGALRLMCGPSGLEARVVEKKKILITVPKEN
jgi:hypothetical protein